jgi:hypothetical protein
MFEHVRWHHERMERLYVSGATYYPRPTAATMSRAIACRAAFVALLLLTSSAAIAAAADDHPATPAPANDRPGATSAPERWTAYGFNVVAPASMWPMLELLHAQRFDWELASASQRPTQLLWANLAPGSLGQYAPTQNVIRLSGILQNSTVELATAYLAHELTHLNDDLNGRLGEMSGGACYESETRAFVNEANFWQMVVGPFGKTTQDAIEQQENMKMFAFVGNARFADLVVRTTPSYIKQCGVDRSR